jgi:hypothetical protein
MRAKHSRLQKNFELNKELKVHAIALAIAILGPLVNVLLGSPYSSPPPGMYLYWAIALLFYILVLIPFIGRSPMRLLRLVIFGITVEDFFSNVWRSIFLARQFLPFNNWYTQHFPFLDSLGEPTPYILIPQWYLAAIAAYVALTAIQHRAYIVKTFSSMVLKKT